MRSRLCQEQEIDRQGHDNLLHITAVSDFHSASLRLRPLDLEFMRRLSKITNVVPVIAKADTLTLEERAEFKQKVSGGAHTVGGNATLVPGGTSLQADEAQRRPVRLGEGRAGGKCAQSATLIPLWT